MSSNEMYAYDPHRIAMLRDRTRETIDALRATTSDDPAAGAAVAVARLASIHLEDDWIPLLDGALSSEAMVGWSSIGPVAITLRSADELISAFDDAAERFDASTSWEEQQDAWNDMSSVLGEIAEQAEHDSALAAEIVTAIGLDDLLTAIDQARYRARNHMGPDHSDHTWTVDIAEPAATIIGAASRAGQRSADMVLASADTHPIVGTLAALAVDAFDPDVIVALAATLVVPPDLYEPPERREAAAALAAAVVAWPVLALELLADPAAAEAILVAGRLRDDDLTAALVESGLGRSVTLDPDRLAEGGRVLDSIVVLAGQHSLTTGARHGLAVAFAPYLRSLNHNSLMDDFGGVELVTEDRSEDNHSVTTDDLQRLWAQILADEEGQVLLMAVVTQYGDELLADSLDRLAAGEEQTLVSAPVRRYAELLDLALDAIDDENARLAIAADTATAGRNDVLSLLGAGLSAAGSPASIGVGVLATLLPDGEPQHIDASYVTQRAFNDATVGYVERVLATPALARRVAWHIDPVDEARIRALAAEYRTTADVVAADDLVVAMTSIIERSGNGDWMNGAMFDLGLADD